MSSLSAFLVICCVLFVSLPAAYWQICRARQQESDRDRIVRAARERDTERAREVDDLELLYSQPAYDRAWDAGRERLWNAIQDEQPKGD